MNYFSGRFENKKVLVLGHTGFKGAWLTLWLKNLGARVFGISIDIPTDPSHFEAAGFDQICQSHFVDVRDREALLSLFLEIQPDFVFHLAAQALVRLSYDDPIRTFETNTLGTLNVLESLRQLSTPTTAIMITSDKAYENIEMVHGYRESDRLGGKDPYSASKGAAEIIISGFHRSFFLAPQCKTRIAIARAGNVIGGGDWAADRLIPDAVRAWSCQRALKVRAPYATRPWQHVLEPLSGYLHLASELAARDDLLGEPFNFGPHAEDLASVGDVVKIVSEALGDLKVIEPDDKTVNRYSEAGLLKLSCDKAQSALNWQPVLRLSEAVPLTAEWYRKFYAEPSSARKISNDQLTAYCELSPPASP
ncbi:MAG: CDP-glucose 4,6-dehydratase [Proteobacteria bacterium]|nr:CDP-glucose 4,6-dehydratase [Pseudomonadota bacterium]